MRWHSAVFRLALAIAIGPVLSGLESLPALAESVPFNCMILPGEDVAGILMSNALGAPNERIGEGGPCPRRGRSTPADFCTTKLMSLAGR
jgi:hypothetical protein